MKYICRSRRRKEPFITSHCSSEFVVSLPRVVLTLSIQVCNISVEAQLPKFSTTLLAYDTIYAMAPIGMFSAAFPPAPKFTEVNLPSLTGKVYIITGAASGVGYELTKMLYSAGGTVYIAARSRERCEGAIKKLFAEKKATTGKLNSMVVDLEDLNSVKGAVSEFLSKESRLDALVHNAGVMTPPAGSKDKLVRKP